MSSVLKKKSTLRSTFIKSIKTKKIPTVGKLSARYFFRAAIRRVIEYKSWIGNDIYEFIGEDVINNAKFAEQKKQSETEFSVKDRAIFLIPPIKRTKEEIEYIYNVILRFKAYAKFPEDIRESLAGECIYQYLPAGRIIIRQNHKPCIQYFIIKGQLKMLNNVTDYVTGEVKETEIGILSTGDMFGTISLMHKINRSATVVSKTDVDLILIKRNVFNAHLKTILLDQWDELCDALVNFNYFKCWNQDIIRECCILSKTVDFKSSEILLGDGKGMVHYVYFILSGECQLIEHMLVEKKKIGKKMRYKIYDFHEKDKVPNRKIDTRNRKMQVPDDSLSTVEKDTTSQKKLDVLTKQSVSSPEDYLKLITAKKTNTNVTMDRISVVTVTLQDIINQWHEITDVVEMLTVEPCIKNMGINLKNVSTIFMQICIFTRGACFGLGENMKNRRVVSLTPVKCLMIPRYYLMQHNRANIWTKVKNFLNSKYPDNQQLLQKFVENREWAKHRRECVTKIINRSQKLRNDTKMYHVPYFIRINENIHDE